MIEIQCTSCHTRYRIDERVLPDDTPTFKCSRCGHVFNADPVPARVRKMTPQEPESPQAPESESQESQSPRTIRPARPRASALKSPVESDVVKREVASEARQPFAPKPEPRPQRPQPQAPRVEPQKPREFFAPQTPPAPPVQPEIPKAKPAEEPQADDPLNRTFGDRDQKADTGENLKFDFSDERGHLGDPTPENELERPEPPDSDWQVGDAPADFEHAARRQAPSMMADPQPAPRPTPTTVRRMAAPLEAEMPRFAHPPTPAKSSGFQLGQADDDDTAEEASPGPTHASGVFLALFFFVAIVFLGASALICDEPVASARILSGAPRIGDYFARPIVPAMLVTLHDVHSEYYALKGGHVALLITGAAQNVGNRPLHLVAIDADLIGAGASPLSSLSVYCGNELSPTMLGEMTPREIEFSQGLSPQKTFTIEPSASAPFLMVFIDPPTGAGKIRISVSKAESSSITAPPA
ncbi:MAG TPA: zinc-ribbon domain-containing protein [Candidatus Binatus sp.]|nr:zinc-ribbon domain-containing protein [Candidatus Binatus sp.]